MLKLFERSGIPAVTIFRVTQVVGASTYNMAKLQKLKLSVSKLRGKHTNKITFMHI
jgi:hypothetical protein